MEEFIHKQPPDLCSPRLGSRVQEGEWVNQE